jgi:hypothetical protein
MKYVLGILFVLVALIAISLVAYLTPPRASEVGMQQREMVATISLAIVGMLYIAARCVEKVWLLFRAPSSK